ncbi:MAG: hypothetical protein RMY34_36070 [Aulosira sp. DedQUE10]|nr:hypothetical protein [Aulosira sp. DedQUE10]
MSGYDPSNFRPGQPGWTGQVGKIAVVNTTSAPVEINLYHPDAPGGIFGTYEIDPGANIFLADGGNIGMDWGIQVGGSDIRIVGLVSDWNEFGGEFIFQTWPDRILANMPTYDPSSFRPGTRGWTGQIGRIAFINLTDKTLWVRLYHPDAPGNIFGTYQIDPGANNFLADAANIGMDWGIQVGGSDIRIVGLVSDWGEFEGTYNFQTWADRVIQTDSRSVKDQILHALRKFAWSWTLRCDGITPSKFQGNECVLDKGGGDGVGDSVIFSSILCLSGERWACESIRQSQGIDGRMWRSPQRIGIGDRPEIRGKNGEFSRDQLLGAMLYMVTSANAGRRDEAQVFGNKLWDWIATKRLNEIQKALDAATDLDTLRKLLKDPRGVLDTLIGGAVPSRYRICDYKDDYCSISLIPYGHWGRLMMEVWEYVGADISITKSVSKRISLPSIPFRSSSILGGIRSENRGKE